MYNKKQPNKTNPMKNNTPTISQLLQAFEKPYKKELKFVASLEAQELRKKINQDLIIVQE